KPHQLFIVAFVAATASCAAPVASPSLEPARIPAGWKPIDVGPFTFHAPTDVVELSPAGVPIDSLVRECQGKSIALGFDYGRYSSSLSYDDDPTFRSHEEMVAGKLARFASWTDARDANATPINRLGVFFRDTGRKEMRLMMT